MSDEIIIKEYLKKVPLNHLSNSSPKIELFCREIYLKKNKKADIFVFLQGGPGFPSPRDISNSSSFKAILKQFRIVLLDQRGTGKSQKIGPELCGQMNQKEAVDFFIHHRADQIVYDLEYLRDNVFKVKKWFLLAQSYGGFITFTYLSFFPEAIKGAILCGGLPPLFQTSVKDIYGQLTSFIAKRNLEFFQAHPKDKLQVKKILILLKEDNYKLPDGGILSPERFLDIGSILGSTNGINQLHYFLDDPFLNSKEDKLSFAFVKTVIDRTSFETNPIYAVLHESIYCDGNKMVSQWAADQWLKKKSIFNPQKMPVSFYGETIRKNMFSEYRMLKPFKNIAETIAQKSDWNNLYDLNKINNNTVPIEAMVYKTDYYVNYEFSLETLKNTGNAKSWIHDTWQHDSLRTQGGNIIPKLLKRILKRI
ncbi:MAG: hypothetical protein COA79_04855 [Planctomycetota bacterium]|nr:MAG: hypothetical protein COA79_04855 [Planctomycetota bacterium]